MIHPIRFRQAAFALLLLSAANFAERTSLRADDHPTSIDANLTAEFKDKIVLLEVNRSSAVETKSSTVLLEKLHVTKLGNRDFLIGTGYAPENNDEYWYKDMTVGIPCDSIVRFHAMTPKQFVEFMKKWKDHSDK
jgi:hypothetical protein